MCCTSIYIQFSWQMQSHFGFAKLGKDLAKLALFSYKSIQDTSHKNFHQTSLSIQRCRVLSPSAHRCSRGQVSLPEHPGSHHSWARAVPLPWDLWDAAWANTGWGQNPECPFHTCNGKADFTLTVLLGPSEYADPIQPGQLVLIDAAPLSVILRNWYLGNQFSPTVIGTRIK